MIDLKQLRSLVKLMVENDLTELDLADASGEHVKLRRGPGEQNVQFLPAPVGAVGPQPAAPAAAESAGAAPAKPKEDDGLVAIPSPMVGTFYASPRPDAAPFVDVGDRVTPETVVCIVEAMKVFNEIKAETTGTIVKALIANGQAVEYGQAMFMIKPG